MNFIKKIFLFAKNLFNRNNQEYALKKLEQPKRIDSITEKINFTEALKVDMPENRKNIKVETLICEGDGLGIQKKISF